MEGPGRLVAIVLCVTAFACGDRASTAPQGVPAPAAEVPTVTPPPGDGPSSPIELGAVAAAAVHPDVFAAALADAGFAGASERVETGGDDFARVVTRRLAFDQATGPAEAAAWIEANVGAELFPVEPLAIAGLPAGVTLLRHVPDGCCPREVRIYLAMWPDGTDLITVQAQGPRATDDEMVNLIDHLHEEG
jgi:hypothetical protein